MFLLLLFFIISLFCKQKKRLNKEAELEKTSHVATSTTAAKKEFKELKTVSSSPFKAAVATPNQTTSDTSSKAQPVGKLKINSQFLQTSSTTSHYAHSKSPEPAAPIAAVQPSEPPVKATASSATNQLSSAPSTAPYQPPSYLKNSQASDNEDDEWADNADPIKITPTHSAPLATYDEHEEAAAAVAASASTNNYSETNNHDDFTNNHQDTAAAASEAGFTAVALYDYQAADEDEISFDPNDIITDIIKVFQWPYRMSSKKHLI
jgi:hypothetical protein